MADGRRSGHELNFSFSICPSWNSDWFKLYKPFIAAICLYLVRVRNSNILLSPRKREKSGKAGREKSRKRGRRPGWLDLLSSAFDVYCKRDVSRNVSVKHSTAMPEMSSSLAGLLRLSSPFSSRNPNSFGPIPCFVFMTSFTPQLISSRFHRCSFRIFCLFYLFWPPNR